MEFKSCYWILNKLHFLATLLMDCHFFITFLRYLYFGFFFFYFKTKSQIQTKTQRAEFFFRPKIVTDFLKNSDLVKSDRKSHYFKAKSYCFFAPLKNNRQCPNMFAADFCQSTFSQSENRMILNNHESNNAHIHFGFTHFNGQLGFVRLSCI